MKNGWSSKEEAQQMSCKMSIKGHETMLENMEKYSQKRGELFLQDILDFKRYYQRVYDEIMVWLGFIAYQLL